MAREQREQRAPAAVARKAPTVRRVASGILAFLILFYIGYQIWAANYESLKFETAAMANAPEKVKNIADYVTVHDNDHHGVVEVIRRFF